MTTTTSSFTVGTTVRVRHPQHAKITCRAIIATLHQDENSNSACLILDDDIFLPKPLKNNVTTRFLISPTTTRSSSSKNNDDDSSEFTVSIDDIQELLAFETTAAAAGDCNAEEQQQHSIGTWKDRGDQLFRLGDAAAAVPYYEMALNLSTHVDIGGTVIILKKGFPKLAEIDCVEEEGLDITIVETGEELTIKPKDIVLGIQESDDEQLQERILLNLARCMLQIADVDSTIRPKYFKAAVLACSVVLTIASYREDEGSKNCQTALYIRSKAQSGLSKWPHAIADAKKLTNLGNEQGPKLLAKIEKDKKAQVKQDKKLAKAVSRWVQTATAESVSEKNDDDDDGPPQEPLPPPTNHPTNRPALTFSVLPILVALIAALLIQKYLG